MHSSQVASSFFKQPLCNTRKWSKCFKSNPFGNPLQTPALLTSPADVADGGAEPLPLEPPLGIFVTGGDTEGKAKDGPGDWPPPLIGGGMSREKPGGGGVVRAAADITGEGSAIPWSGVTEALPRANDPGSLGDAMDADGLKDEASGEDATAAVAPARPLAPIITFFFFFFWGIDTSLSLAPPLPFALTLS